MNIKVSTKKNLLLLLQSFLIAWGLTIRMQPPLHPAHYSDTIHYLLAEIELLLGGYQFLWIPVFIMSYCFLRYVGQLLQSKYCGYLLPGLFAFCLYIGQSYREIGSWGYCFGSIVNFLRFLPAFAGMTILLRQLIGLLLWGYEQISKSSKTRKLSRCLFDRHCFIKIFLVLMVLWAPILLLSYPGNLCYDAIGQIDQVVGRTDYSSHHPLLHTLLMGGMTEGGYRLFGSYEIGLFLYMIVQSSMLASGLAGTIWWLNRQHFAKGPVSHSLLLILLGIYVFAPVYSNIASTALKDVPFAAMFIWYMILLAELCLHRERLKDLRFAAVFVIVQVLVGLLRNNGFYVILITGVLLVFLWWKQAGKELRLRMVLYLFAIPVITCKLMGGVLLAGLNAEKGKSAEIFSLPFQQTARYLLVHPEGLSPEEEAVVANVLADPRTIAEKYDPDIADPVKSLFYDHEDVTGGELLAYFKVWFQCFFRDPAVYMEAFFAHAYGWFDPGASNAIRYEAVYEVIPRQGLFPKAATLLKYAYSFAEQFTPLGVLQNVGIYTWLMLILFAYTLRRNKSASIMLIPLLVSLLICIAAPCFYLHPRYAFPYMFTIPFLYGLAERSQD